MGKSFMNYIDGQKAFKVRSQSICDHHRIISLTSKVFQDEDGKFNYDKFKELIENHSFRRHWIQRVTTKLVELLKLASDEKIQKQLRKNTSRVNVYLTIGVFFFF